MTVCSLWVLLSAALPGHAQVDWSCFHGVVATHPDARSKRHGQQMQQQSSLSPASSISAGTWQQQQQQPAAVPDAFSSQVAAADEQFNGNLPAQQQLHQQLLGRRQLNRVPSSRSSSRDIGISNSLSAVVVHDDSEPAGQQPHQDRHQQLQCSTQPSHLSDSTAFGSPQMIPGSTAVPGQLQVAHSHSLGFRELHQISMMSSQQRSEDGLSPRALLRQEQQQGRWKGASSSFSSHTASAGSAAFDRMTAAAAAAGWDWEEDEECDEEQGASFTHSNLTGTHRRATNTSQAKAQRQQQQLQQEQEQMYEETHTLTMLPGRMNSWSGKRSLAGIMDLFEQQVGTTAGPVVPPPAGIVEDEASSF
jgi:hypothetical protein